MKFKITAIKKIIFIALIAQLPQILFAQGNQPNEISVNTTKERIEIRYKDTTYTISIDPKTGLKSLDGVYYGKDKNLKYTFDYVAYVPYPQKLVFWNKKDSTKYYDFNEMEPNWYGLNCQNFILRKNDIKASGHIRYEFDFSSKKMYYNSVDYQSFIVRHNVEPNGVFAERTLYFRQNSNNRMSIQLYDKFKQTHLFGNLLEISPALGTKSFDWQTAKINLKQNPPSTYFPLVANYFTHTDFNKSIQFVSQATDKQLGKEINQAITLSSDLRMLTVYNNPVVIHIMPEVWDPNQDKMQSRVYGYNKNNYAKFMDFELSTGKKTRPAVRYRKQILIPNKEFEQVYIPLNYNGNTFQLAPDIVGIIPTYSMVSDDGLDVDHKRHPDKFRLGFGWVTAYMKNDSLSWGWASSEFSHVTPPLWKDFDIYEEGGDPFLTGINDYRMSKPVFFGETSISKQLALAEGMILMGQLFNGDWQMYVQPNYINTRANFNMPNNYSGDIPGGKTYEEALGNGMNYLKKFKKQYDKDVTETVKIYLTMIQKDNYKNEWLEARRAEEKAFFKEQEKRREEIEERLAEARRARTAQLVQQAGERSFSSRLQNMSSTNSSLRATQRLTSESNRIRQATGKGY